MGLMQRRKGRAFEERVARAYREALPGLTVRRSLQAHRPYEPDVVIEGLPIWTECQDARRPTPGVKHSQAQRDLAAARARGAASDKHFPVVVWHRLREREVWVSLALVDLLRFFIDDPAGGQDGDLATGLMVAGGQSLVTVDFHAWLRLLGLLVLPPPT